jgi:hypothetical protein
MGVWMGSERASAGAEIGARRVVPDHERGRARAALAEEAERAVIAAGLAR